MTVPRKDIDSLKLTKTPRNFDAFEQDLAHSYAELKKGQDENRPTRIRAAMREAIQGLADPAAKSFLVGLAENLEKRLAQQHARFAKLPPIAEPNRPSPTGRRGSKVHPLLRNIERGALQPNDVLNQEPLSDRQLDLIGQVLKNTNKEDLLTMYARYKQKYKQSLKPRPTPGTGTKRPREDEHYLPRPRPY